MYQDEEAVETGAEHQIREVGLYRAEVLEVGTSIAQAKLKVMELDNLEVWASPLDSTTHPPVGASCWLMFVPRPAGEMEHLYTWAQPISDELQRVTAGVAALESRVNDLAHTVHQVVTALIGGEVQIKTVTPKSAKPGDIVTIVLSSAPPKQPKSVLIADKLAENVTWDEHLLTVTCTVATSTPTGHYKPVAVFDDAGGKGTRLAYRGLAIEIMAS